MDRKKEIIVADKIITIYSDEDFPMPVVYLNTVRGEGERVWDICKKTGCLKFALAAVSKLHWNHDMSPWAIPSIGKQAAACTGGADDYLTLLTSRIMDAVESELSYKPLYNAIAGYSLAGLFAVYALYKTDVFSRAASVSGSLWFPDFLEYSFRHSFCKTPRCIYFSLGKKESRTKNPILKTVEEKTRQLEGFYRKNGILTEYVENQGNHFQDADIRIAKGIQWILL